MICSIDGLPPELAASASAEEKSHIALMQRRGLLPFAVTAHFASLARPERDDPIRRQFFPDPREALPDPFALDDPLGEARHRAAPCLVHQYPDRALLLAARACAGYCRHCFRRVWISSRDAGAQSGASFQPNAGFQPDANPGAGASFRPASPQSAEPAGWREALAYLAAHGEIREVLGRVPTT